MERRRLGRTGIEVGVIGLGTEYLVKPPEQDVIRIVHEAIDHGVNYFDMLFPFPDYRDRFGAAFSGRRDKVVIAGHLGSATSGHQHKVTRDAAEADEFFADMLRRFRTDYVDVVILSVVDPREDFEQIVAPGGLLELALRYKQQGKARFVGMSSHTLSTVNLAAQNGHIDVLMVPVHMRASPEGFCSICASHGIAVVGMKPYFGGEFFHPPFNKLVTPIKALSYSLSQPGVATLVPGVKNLGELHVALSYLDASREEREFMSILPEFRQQTEGTCLYCAHCLPCTSGIDITQIIWSVRADVRKDAEVHEFYSGLEPKASACKYCGECMKRCPFGVKVTDYMREAIRVFGR